MPTLLMVLFLLFPAGVPSEPVRLSPEQISFLSNEAAKTKQLSDRMSLILSEEVMADSASTDPVGGGVPRTENLKWVLSNAITAVNNAHSRFAELPATSTQREATRVFFDDLSLQYGEVRRELESPDYSISDYAHLRNETIRLVERNYLAYTTVAEKGSLTFDLEVISSPENASVAYRRKGDKYVEHPDRTDTTVENLVYAVWIVRVQKQDYEEQEKTHDPFRETKHIVKFNLVKK